MRRTVLNVTTALTLATALTPTMTAAQTIPDTDWQLLAVDGLVIDYSATLRVDANGQISGKAPCNSWSAQNGADLPDLALKGIRATRMACDQLSEEQAFFDQLALMTKAELNGTRNLILTGLEGQSMEFVSDRMNSLTTCETCPPKD
jgi:heat shock protein HslJ